MWKITPNDDVFDIIGINNMNISGLTVKGAFEYGKAGINLNGADYCNVSNNNALNNYEGISLWYLNNGIIMNNKALNNNHSAIYLYCLSNSTIMNNNASNNNGGILSYSLSSSTITNNSANSNIHNGISLFYSSNNTITNNNVLNNSYGIILSGSRSCNLSNNTMEKNGILIEGSIEHFNTHEIDTSNAVNGKAVYYWKNRVRGIIPSGAGQVILANCSNIIVSEQNLSYTTVGIEIGFSTNCTIRDNIASNNRYGILLYYSSENMLTNNNANSNNAYGIELRSSSKNTLTNNNINSNNVYGIYLRDSLNNIIIRNNISSNDLNGISLDDSSSNVISKNTISSTNKWNGIWLWNSSNNTIYLNNFINNSNNVYSHDSANIWNSTLKITYTYNSSQYTNYLGNYWDDYTGIDADNDGIGDTPYSIDSDEDNYPLMVPWENYFAPTENIFDTGAGTYPSIMGTHKGEIKPSCNINVSKLYTYPCVGTGGHTESIKLYDENGILIANGTWNGYQDDYHNITITPSVTLLAGHTYNYTIATGSYPQIIHAKSSDVTGGTITCTSFVDANGKTYNDWIPAIRLE